MDFELYNAVISGNTEVLKEISGRLNVANQFTPTKYNVLHLASQYGNLTCVKEILSTHESLLLKVNSRGETPLHLAAREGHYLVAQALINAAKSSVLQLNDIQTLSSTVVEFLIRTPNVEFETALHEAVRYNHFLIVSLLVIEDPSHRHPPNKNGETPLYLASLKGYILIISAILDKCVSPTFGGPEGRTALHGALLYDNGVGCVRLLLQNNNELISITDDYGWTIFHYAAARNYAPVIKDLMDVDRSIAYQVDTKYKRTPLHVAAHEDCVDVMHEILKHCPDSCDIVDGSGRNILHIAVIKDHKDVIEYILKNCIEINNLLIQKDKQGNTPMHLMAKLGCYVSEIMDHKQVDWWLLNNENLNPHGVLVSRSTTYLADQRKIQRKLRSANIRFWDMGSRLKQPDYENEDTLDSYIKKNTETVEDYRKLMNTHMIVAALITTVALTAGFAMPGGFDGNAGPNEGSPALIKKASFKTFVVTDAIALLCSFSSLFIYFMTVLNEVPHHIRSVIAATIVLNILSIIAMMMAFITGTYAVLAHSSALAITVSIISSFFFVLVYFLFKIL